MLKTLVLVFLVSFQQNVFSVEKHDLLAWVVLKWSLNKPEINLKWSLMSGGSCYQGRR